MGFIQNGLYAQPEILYEDIHLVILRKPAGWLSQSGAYDTEGEPELVSWLLERERRKRIQPEGSDRIQREPYIGAVHRLDRGVGGVMVYAKDKRTAAQLSEIIRSRSMIKQYLCVVSGVPALPAGEYRDLLFKDARQNKVYVVDRMRDGVREAVLSYRVLERFTMDGTRAEDIPSEFSLLLVTLGSGRSHQIRAQLSHHGTPILGDGKYGGRRPALFCSSALADEDMRAIGAGEIALCSYRLAFPHPANAGGNSSKGASSRMKKGKERFSDIDIRALPDRSLLPWGWFSFASVEEETEL